MDQITQSRSMAADGHSKTMSIRYAYAISHRWNDTLLTRVENGCSTPRMRECSIETAKLARLVIGE